LYQQSATHNGSAYELVLPASDDGKKPRISGKDRKKGENLHPKYEFSVLSVHKLQHEATITSDRPELGLPRKYD
jgi:hypothetical protein